MCTQVKRMSLSWLNTEIGEPRSAISKRCLARANSLVRACDALLELMPGVFQLLEGAQMRGDFRLKPIARGKPQELRRQSPNHDGRRQRQQRPGRLQQPLEFFAGDAR